MKTKLSPTLIGIFVIGGFLLLLIGVFAFGGASLFTKPQRFAVFFDESVHGLDPGAPVKVRGVRVGRVADITVRFDAAKHDSVVAVVCEVTKNVLVGPEGKRIDFSESGRIDELVKDGMRAELAVQGLATGLLYVELSFDEEQKYPLPANLPQADMPVVPAVPSMIAEFTASITEILGKLGQVDYAGISTELKALMATTRTKIDALKLQPAIDEVQSAAAAVYTPEGQTQVKTLVDFYLGNAKLVRETFAARGLQCVGGDNSPYIWVNVGRDSWEFFDLLLNQGGVVCTPGAGFGRCGQGYVRFSAFNSRANVEEALARVAKLL